MNTSTLALENQYFLLRTSLSELTNQGATEAQLNVLRTAIATSRNNYWTATRSILHDDDPEVAALISQMNTIQLTLEQTIKHLGEIAKVLDEITKAVDVGSQLAAKAVSI
jgi:hypothetical protein